MLKTLKYHLSAIDNIDIYPVISLVIFFVFFSVMLYYVFTMSKQHLHECETLPMEDNDDILFNPNH